MSVLDKSEDGHLYLAINFTINKVVSVLDTTII